MNHVTETSEKQCQNSEPAIPRRPRIARAGVECAARRQIRRAEAAQGVGETAAQQRQVSVSRKPGESVAFQAGALDRDFNARRAEVVVVDGLAGREARDTRKAGCCPRPVRARRPGDRPHVPVARVQGRRGPRRLPYAVNTCGLLARAKSTTEREGVRRWVGSAVDDSRPGLRAFALTEAA